MIEERILLRLADGSTRPVSITRKEDDPTCWLQLSGVGIEESATGTDYFESFATIRRQLAKHRMFPLCYGASNNVCPSGMAIQFTQGLAAYKVTMGLPAEERVNIFDSGPDVDPVTPEEQKAFCQAWLKSLK